MSYFLYLFVALALCILPSCSKNPSISPKPLVIVSVSPYDTFVKEIAGETLDVRVAVPANYNSHLFEPTPRQMEGFQHAQIWFGIGEPFEKTLLKSLKSYDKNLISIDLSIGLLSGDQHNHHHCGTSHEEIDRHFWMSPRLASLQAETIAGTLIELFPAQAELYRKNLLILQEKFTSLDAYLSTTLKTSKNRAIIVSHPSLGYFCQDYHLIQISIESEGKTPLPKDVKNILSLAQKHSASCVFTQEQFDNKGAFAMAKRLELPVYSMNPNSPHYFDLLKKLAKDISEVKSQ